MLLMINIFPTLFENEFMISAIVYAIPILLTLVFYAQGVFKDFSYFKTETFKKVLFLIAGFAVMMLANYGINSIGNLGSTENEQGVSDAVSTVPLIYSAILFGILGPLLEEIIFRRILIKDLSTFINEKFAIVFSLLAFALLHVDGNIMDIFSYIPLSIVITISYIISKKNIAYAWTLHMINNLSGIVVFPLLFT
ncbi:CPBP family intramembrane metalloprotease [Lactococcus garvieae]|nr:CPBP family intramembrane metalloprotease [Lactococcus garvieae]